MASRSNELQRRKMVSAPIGQEYRRIFHGCLASVSGVIHGAMHQWKF